jgi:hypothetical protein
MTTGSKGGVSQKGPQDPPTWASMLRRAVRLRLLRAGTRHKPVSQESTIATPPRRLLYHFTHVRNLPSIVGRGALLSDTHVSSEGRLRVEVGDRNVKARRRSMVVPVGPGGAPADYVPFYFAPRSPMLYVIDRGRVPEYQDGQSPLVYLVTDIETIVRMRLPHVFSDGNCANAFTEYFDRLDRLDMVDWPLMGERIWKNTPTDGDRMRRRAAEFLVHKEVPWSAFIGAATIDEDMARQVRAALVRAGSHLPVRVRRDWYY